MIFIPGEVPSSKNSKVSTASGVFHSKAVRKYLQEIGIAKYRTSPRVDKDGNKPPKIEEYKDPKRVNLFRQAVGSYFDGVEYPAIIGFHFVRRTRRMFDVHNVIHIVADLLVAHDFLVDDDIDHFLPVPFAQGGRWWTLDKHNPGVYLDLLDKGEI